MKVHANVKHHDVSFMLIELKSHTKTPKKLKLNSYVFTLRARWILWKEVLMQSSETPSIPEDASKGHMTSKLSRRTTKRRSIDLKMTCKWIFSIKQDRSWWRRGVKCCKQSFGENLEIMPLKLIRIPNSYCEIFLIFLSLCFLFYRDVVINMQ